MLTRLQTGLLNALDSGDFSNAAEYLHRHGEIGLPGMRFTLLLDGRIRVEHHPVVAFGVYEAIADMHAAYITARQAWLDGKRRKVPSVPRFSIKQISPPLIRKGHSNGHLDG